MKRRSRRSGRELFFIVFLNVNPYSNDRRALHCRSQIFWLSREGQTHSVRSFGNDQILPSWKYSCVRPWSNRIAYATSEGCYNSFTNRFFFCVDSDRSGIIKGPFEWSLIFWVINPPDGYITKAQVRSCFAVRPSSTTATAMQCNAMWRMWWLNLNISLLNI